MHTNCHEFAAFAFALIIAQYCPPLEAVTTNGMCDVSGRKLGDTATYTCNNGAMFENEHVSVDTKTRTCNAQTVDLGAWEPVEPKCIGTVCLWQST